MQNLVGSDTLIEENLVSEHYKYHQQGQDVHYNNYAAQSYSLSHLPRDSHTQNLVAFQEAHKIEKGEYPASPKFYRQDMRYNQQKHQQQNEDESGMYSNRLMNQIKPYMDQILSDQTVNSFEVQKGLQHLRDIHDKMVGDAQGLRFGVRSAGEEHQEREIQQGHQVQGDTNYLLEIQRTVDELIANAQQQTNQFKASLHHLKNVNNSIFNDGAAEQEPNISKVNWKQQKQRSKAIERGKSGTLNSLFEGISVLQDRLFNEIMVLRQQKQQVISQLQHQRQNYNQLEKKYRILQKQYKKLLHQLQGKNIAYDGFSDILHKSLHPSASQFRVPQSIKQRYNKNTKVSRKSQNTNQIRQQIQILQDRLKAAESQKYHLEQQIHRTRRQNGAQGLTQQIRRLDNQLAISQRKAAALFPYKIQDQRIRQQIQQLQGENHYHQVNNHHSRTVNRNKNTRVNNPNDGDNYQSQRYRLNQRSQGRKKSRFADENDKLRQYRQVLNSLRNKY